MSFPPNPNKGDNYTVDGRTYVWNGVRWDSTQIFTNRTAPVYISVSPPANPIPGNLWYSTNDGGLSIYLKDLNGGAWVAITPYPENSIDQNGGTFEGPIYASYSVPNNPAAFATVGSVNTAIQSYLTSNDYVVSGNGVTISPSGQVVSIDGGLLV